MEKHEATGYRKFRASQLPPKEQERLRKALCHELAEALIISIKANPPDINLKKVELVLRPGQSLSDWSVSDDCVVCQTCGTGGGIAICATSSLPEDIPVNVRQQLGIRPREVVDTKNVEKILSQIGRAR